MSERLELPINPEKQEKLFWKGLVLISPETAMHAGIRAEAPVFVSPHVRGEARCPHCEQAFTPLIYQASYTTTAQHMHGETGGIYHLDTSDVEFFSRDTLKGAYTWVAEIEPIGDPIRSGYYLRSPAVQVRNIFGSCSSRISDGKNNSSQCGQRLQEGLLVAAPGSTEWMEALLPICKDRLDTHDGFSLSTVRFSFKANEDGGISFSQVKL